jgi:hypothetical protein
MTTPAAFAPAFATWPATSSREAAATFAIAAISSRRAISPTLIDSSLSSSILHFRSGGGDPDETVEDITPALSRIKSLFVTVRKRLIAFIEKNRIQANRNSRAGLVIHASVAFRFSNWAPMTSRTNAVLRSIRSPGNSLKDNFSSADCALLRLRNL